MNSTSKTILAIMGAAAVGAVIGLLVAPEKGSELRKRISDTTGDWSNQLSQLLASGKEQLNNLKGRVGSEADKLASETEDRLSKTRERVS